MQGWDLKTPVVFIIFNRPEATATVFEEIRRAKPPKLMVIADGPRPDRPGEVEKCAAARAVIDRVDWPCEVFTNYSDVNLGCKHRVSSGLNWVFDVVEEAIILEDDCVPHPTFFRFCEELLERYRDDKRVMVISGNNFQFGRKRTGYSYYFSRYNHVWGWASWRWAWRHYDVDMKLWPEIRDGKWLSDLHSDDDSVHYWTTVFEKVYRGEIDTWDYQWTFACWVQSGLSILPSVNLVSNIGFGHEATHTKGESRFANMKTEAMNFPLAHSPLVVRDSIADSFTERNIFLPRTTFSLRVINGIRGAVDMVRR
ncbi:MAG: glycosyltransferase family 2 protein [Deltaproteobacteria bacterium]|nr:glycosyltransferase family 2 protein [Deltaproteobacteria bacterium]